MSGACPRPCSVVADTVAPGSRPSLAVDGNGVLHIAWVDTRSDAYDLYHSSRPASGGAWSQPVRINDAPGQVWGPALAADVSGTVCAAWRDSRDSGALGDETQNRSYIYASKRPAGGSWGPNVRISSSDLPEDRAAPALALSGGALHLAWADFREGNSDVYYDRITTAAPIWNTGGAYLTVNQRVNPDDDEVDQVDPAIAVDTLGNVYVAWADAKNMHAGDENWDVYAAMLPTGGTSWAGITPQRLDNDGSTQPQGQPTLTIDGTDRVYAAWRDGRERGASPYYWSIRAARLVSQGGLPLPVDGINVRLNDATASPGREQPVLAAANDQGALAVWRDFQSGTPCLYSAFLPADSPHQLYLPVVLRQ